MKRITLLLLLIAYTLPSFSQNDMSAHNHKMSALVNKFSNKDTINIGILAYDGMTLQDFAGPVEVFSKAQTLTAGHYQLYVIGLTKKMVRTENNLVNITPDYTLDNMPHCNYFILPGAPMSIVDSLRQNSAFQHKWLQWKKKSDSSQLISICTAAYYVAQNGLLDDQKSNYTFFCCR